MVISGGQGYFVEVNQRKIIAQTNWDHIDSAIFNKKSGRVVISNGFCIAMIEGFKTIWKSQRISLDGISLKESSDQIIKGTLNDCTQDGSEFCFDVLKKEITGKWLFYNSVG